MGDHASDSSVQSEAEHQILAALARQEALPILGSGEARVAAESPVQVDGRDRDTTVFVEVYARVGKLKSGQQRKIAQDVLKLLSLKTSYPDARLYLAFASSAAVQSVTRWVRAVAEAGGIRVVVVEPDESLARRISEAQVRQRMVNPPTV